MNKRQNGQYFTTSNPFALEPFEEWIELAINSSKNKTILEPFAGENHIVKAFQDIYGYEIKWKSYDIQLGRNMVPSVKIEKRDTLKNFPKRYSIIITNPPYLAKNSATRRKLKYPRCEYVDLYRYALCMMLENSKFVAAIIPESYITNVLFENRLLKVISLTTKMFNDTDCPSCLALFVPEETKASLIEDVNDFEIYRLDKKLGNFLDFKAYHNSLKPSKIKFRVNDKSGKIGGHFIDGTVKDSIRFMRGECIDPDRIKVSSRSITRISGIELDDENLDILLENANRILNEYRKNTEDIFLTSFKGLREDGKYRRRLDFATAKNILYKAYIETFK